MPRQFNSYEPDAIDCNAMWSALCNDFAVIPVITTTYARDKVVVIAKCYKIAGDDEGVVQVQAMVSAPLKAAKSGYVMQYSVLLDCWHQCDRGVLAAATRPVERNWIGRPQVPARTRKP